MNISVPFLQANSEPVKTHALAPLIDLFGRKISYVRVSVTDRCDMRCVYCMSENMSFLPRNNLLSLEELDRLCRAFIQRGVDKLRITGGEPLVRRNIIGLFRSLSQHLETGALRELTLTTNGSQLFRFADDLASCGVKRINISLDTLDPIKFRAITRWGDHAQVMKGIDAAQAAGLKIKINMVALKGVNDGEIIPMIEWAHGRGMDLTLIETMPLGEIEPDRINQYLPLTEVRASLARAYHLRELDDKTGGPARYMGIEETGGRLGLITPLSHNFCEGCNRVRVTCTGTLYLCLGQDDAADLRSPLRASSSDELLHQTLEDAVARKPKGHDFVIDHSTKKPAVARHMSVTGG
jgi:cyclic pyranopterin phosphate synthase